METIDIDPTLYHYAVIEQMIVNYDNYRKRGATITYNETLHCYVLTDDRPEDPIPENLKDVTDIVQKYRDMNYRSIKLVHEDVQYYFFPTSIENTRLSSVVYYKNEVNEKQAFLPRPMWPLAEIYEYYIDRYGICLYGRLNDIGQHNTILTYSFGEDHWVRYDYLELVCNEKKIPMKFSNWERPEHCTTPYYIYDLETSELKLDPVETIIEKE